MSKKDYKKGMADAMEAYEAFGEKQENAIRHVGQEVEKTAQKVDKLGGKIGEIADYITDKEKAELYRLNTPVDIADLEDAEKRILLAVLYQLSADADEVTEEQQNYLRAVQQYLKIYNPQTEIDLSAVENIEDISAQKAVLQAVLEFFRLGAAPEELTEGQEDFLDYFQVNRRTRREIDGFIDAIVEAVGIKGLAEKYGNTEMLQQAEEQFEEALKVFENRISEYLHVSSGVFCYLSPDKNWSNITRMACSDSESYKEQSKCRNEAQRSLERYHREIAKQMASYTKRYGEKSIYKSLADSLDSQLRGRKTELSKLRNSQTTAVLGEIEQYLTKTKVIDEIDPVYDRLTDKYHLPVSGGYNSQIEYEVWDPSEFEDNLLAKAFAKGFKRYGYTINSAVDSITNDGNEKLKDFEEDLTGEFNSLIDKYIIDPIQKLLPKLWDAISEPEEDY